MLHGINRIKHAGYGAEVVGYGVCDDEQYFYDFIDNLYQGLGADAAARDTVRLVQAKGGGYGISRYERANSGSCVYECHCACEFQRRVVAQGGGA